MYKEKIDAYLDDKREEMLDDLKKLVRINSQKGEAKEGRPFGDGPAEALHMAEQMMRQYGLTTRNYDNYVVTGDFSDQEKGLDILAHLDVVPVTEDWTVTQPFEPKVVDGRIYGRGTADDKGPAVAALYALRAIRELGIPLKKSVRLILGSDEECGSGDLKHYYSIEQEAPYTFTPDADFPVINIEKGRLEGTFDGSFSDGLKLPGIVTLRSGDKANVVPQRASMKVAGLERAVLSEAAKEVLEQTGVAFIVRDTEEKVGHAPVFVVEAKGQAAHASTPQEGKNALTAMVRLAAQLPLAQSQGISVLKALDRLFPYEDTCGKALGVYREEETSGEVTLCFSILEYTPDGICGTFDARLPIGCTTQNTKEPIAKALSEVGLTLDQEPMVQPHCVPGDSAFVRTLLESYERYTGQKGEPQAIGGGTYVHELERGVAFGCASPDLDNHMHGDNEFMEIDTLLMSAKIFADAVIKICNDL